jgi:hypothetical protein
MATTRDIFLARIKAELADATGTYFADTEVEQWIQDCHADLARDTHYYRTVVHCAIVANQEKYEVYPVTVGSQLLTPLEFTEVLVKQDASVTTYRALEPLTWDIYRRYQNGKETATTAGTPGSPTHYCLQGNYLYLYPYPNYNAATNGLRLYIIAVEHMVADSTVSNIPIGFEDAVVWYGAWRGHMKDQSTNLAANYLGKYERMKKELGGWANSMRTGGPERIKHVSERRIA